MQSLRCLPARALDCEPVTHGEPMTSNEWWMLIGLALAVGLIAGGWAMLQLARRRHAAETRRLTDELLQRFSNTLAQLRSAQVRAQTELEQARNSFRRQLAVVADEPRAAAARAEERLRAAYEEMDRLRRGARFADTMVDEGIDGFAATRPMRDGM
jgi:triphosphoribosyl-dephospho-CoA synthetase